MTNLEKLETAIRQALPELMELTEGCQVSYNGKIGTVTKVNILESFRLIEINYMQFFYVPEQMPIIGHPITLLHLLRWLGMKEYYTGLYNEGSLCFDEIDNIKIDLSKTLLSQQSEEVINELVKLLK